jgi:hypothetical protein
LNCRNYLKLLTKNKTNSRLSTLQSLMMGIYKDNSVTPGTGFSADTSYISKDVLEIKSDSKNKVSEQSLPWNQSSPTPSQSVFFPPIDIQHDRWSALYPYRFLVIDTAKGNSVVSGDQNHSLAPTIEGSGDDYILTFIPMGRKWQMTLPITPQQLTITDQFAINTSATLRGIIEEHNGVKFKTITMAGTMGVWPYKESVTHSPTTPGLLRSILGGTLDAFSSVISSVTNVISDITGDKASKYKATQPAQSTAGKFSTGYYHAMALEQFLEQYAEAKKNPNNASWRLILDIPKQNQSFVITPMQFTWSQNAARAVEINYSMQLKAWRRIDLKELTPPATNLKINKVSPGLLQSILNTITDARIVMAKSFDLINAVRSDADKPLEILRQTSLLLKDGAGVVIAASELPKQIIRDYKSAITDFTYNNRIAITQANTSPNVKRVVGNITQDKTSAEGLSSNAISGGQVGAAAANYLNASPTNAIFQEPDRYFEVFNAVPTSSLSLTTAQSNALNGLLDEIRKITVDDLRQFRNTIAELAYQISNHYGTSTVYYNQIYGKGIAKTRTQPLGLDEYEVLNALYGVTQAFDILTATTYYDDLNKKTNMEYVAGLADSSSIAFSIPISKIVAPVPYGLTIEGIAARYLNDAQRWIEIVTLNALREPYIDETGFQKPLLSNGIDRQITVADSINLYIGQAVSLKSATAIATARRILGIDILSDSSVLLTLDGTPDLESYTLNDKAYLQAYLPGTTNSQQKIFIPSDLAAVDSDGIVTPSAVAGDSLVGLSKVDFLMTDSGDLATNNYGDFRLSAGLTNLIQALRIKMGTIKGTMIAHPSFGLGLRAGMPSSELNAQNIYGTINKLIQDDPRFGGIEKLQIQLSKAAVTINLSVFLANGNGVLPLTFDLKA